MVNRSVGVAILAGGQGRRMGGLCKALLCHGGESFLSRIATAVQMFDERLLSTNDPAMATAIGFVPVKDLHPDAGPLAGVFSALTAARSDALLVVPCDMPLFSRELAKYLAEALRNDDDALVCVEPDGRTHPLCGIYSKNCLPAAGGCLAAGEFSMMALLDKVRTRQVVIDANVFGQDLFANINTWQDYLELERRCMV
jgi:molybdopterin-guanine dinucleotide biosynthesis protein A